MNARCGIALFILLLSYSVKAPAFAAATSSKQDQHVIDSITARLQEKLHDTDQASILNKLARLEAKVMDRRDNLQYSVILIALLVLFGGVLGLGFIKLPQAVAEGLIFFAFLIVFEFLLVLVNPYVDSYTGGASGWKLLINAGIAVLIFPLHAFFERVLKKRLIR